MPRKNRRRQGYGQSQKKQSWIRRKIVHNKRNPSSNWVFLEDIILNIKETFFGWSHRVPNNSRIIWKNGKIIGHTTTHKV